MESKPNIIVSIAGGNCPGTSEVAERIAQRGLEDNKKVYLTDGGLEPLLTGENLVDISQMSPEDRIQKLRLQCSNIFVGKGAGNIELAARNFHKFHEETNSGVFFSIGGDGTTEAMSHVLHDLRLKGQELPDFYSILKTIDGDAMTDRTHGFHTAIESIRNQLAAMRDDAEANQRGLVVQVPGREAGQLLKAGSEGIADVHLPPELKEQKPDDWPIGVTMDDIHSRALELFNEKQTFLMTVSERWIPHDIDKSQVQDLDENGNNGEFRTAKFIASELNRRLRLVLDIQRNRDNHRAIRGEVIGSPELRGQRPNESDVEFAHNQADYAYKLHVENHGTPDAVAIVRRGEQDQAVPMDEVAGQTKFLDLAEGYDWRKLKLK